MFNDYAIRVFVVIIFDSASGGVGTRALSIEGAEDSVGFDDGAEGEIYFKISSFDFDVGNYVGGGDVAADFA